MSKNQPPFNYTICLLVSFLCISSSSCVSTCYQCTSGNSTSCGDPFSTVTASTITCSTTNAGAYSCVKYVYQLSAKTYTVRDCLLTTGCPTTAYTNYDSAGNVVYAGSCCTGNLCNKAAPASPRKSFRAYASLMLSNLIILSLMTLLIL